MIEFVSIPEERIKFLKSDKKWRLQFAKMSDVKVELDDDVSLEGDNPIALMRAKDVFIAFGRGFEFEEAMNMLDEDFMMDIIDVKSFAGGSKNRGKILKGRVIGTHGKIKNFIERNSNAKISIYGKTICIIGKWDEIKIARGAVGMLLSGSKHSSVMRYIQENKNL